VLLSFLNSFKKQTSRRAQVGKNAQFKFYSSPIKIRRYILKEDALNGFISALPEEISSENIP